MVICRLEAALSVCRKWIWGYPDERRYVHMSRTIGPYSLGSNFMRKMVVFNVEVPLTFKFHQSSSDDRRLVKSSGGVERPSERAQTRSIATQISTDQTRKEVSA